jgi:hypothetical protein
MAEPNEYNTSKIYKISSANDPRIYVNGTTQTLKRAMSSQNRKKDCICQELFKHKDAKIELISEFNCNTKQELLKEVNRIKQELDNCINPSISEEERKQHLSELRKGSYERNKETSKKYYAENKDDIKAKKIVKEQCGCGAEYQHRQAKEHLKSKRHTAWIEACNNLPK